MKRTISSIAALAAAALLFTGCTKENAARFEGNYSFKTSGTLTVVPVQGEGGATADSLTLSIVPESGQMDIIRSGKSKSEMKITMNIIGGDAVVFDNVNASGLVLTLLEPYVTRRIAVQTANGVGTASVTVKGDAQKFTDVVLFNLEYEGTVAIGESIYEITGSAIDCVAQEND